MMKPTATNAVCSLVDETRIAPRPDPTATAI
jgi:hypothetical protein